MTYTAQSSHFVMRVSVFHFLPALTVLISLHCASAVSDEPETRLSQPMVCVYRPLTRNRLAVERGWENIPACEDTLSNGGQALRSCDHVRYLNPEADLRAHSCADLNYRERCIVPPGPAFMWMRSAADCEIYRRRDLWRASY